MLPAHVLRTALRALIAISLAYAATGCGNDEDEAPSPPPPGRGMPPAPETEVEDEDEEEAEPEQAPDPFAEPIAQPEPFPEEIPKYEPTIDEEALAAEQPEPRKYDEELAKAVGSPVDCMKPRPAEGAPEEVGVDLEAYVLETGYVSRGSARSSFLDADELKCIQKRVESTRLPGGVEEAPRRITTRVSLKLRVTPDTAAPAATP